MSSEEYYNYYMVPTDQSEKASEKYKKDIETKRHNIQQELLKTTGALTYRESSNWGEPDSICDLVFLETDKKTLGNYIKSNGKVPFEGKRCICVRGKMNSKKGIEFNEPMRQANNELKSLKKFTDWIIHDCFDVMQQGFGANKGFSTAMISSYGGFDKQRKNILIAIPKDCKSRKEATVPEFFEKITYGAFYDLTN